jgi:hypothetical protein
VQLHPCYPRPAARRHDGPDRRPQARRKVIATNTNTGKTTPETVTAVEVNHDTNLYDLNVKTSHGIQVIHTTSNHRSGTHDGEDWASIPVIVTRISGQ